MKKEINEMKMVSDESFNKSKYKRDQVLDQLLEQIDLDFTDHNRDDEDSLYHADEDVNEVLDGMVDSFKSIDHTLNNKILKIWLRKQSMYIKKVKK